MGLCLALPLALMASGHRGSHVSAIIEAGGVLMKDENQSSSVTNNTSNFTHNASTPAKQHAQPEAQRPPTGPTPGKGALPKSIARDLLKMGSFVECFQRSVSIWMFHRREQSYGIEQVLLSESTIFGLLIFNALVICLCCCCSAPFQHAGHIPTSRHDPISGQQGSAVSATGITTQSPRVLRVTQQRSYKQRVKSWVKSFTEDLNPSLGTAELLRKDFEKVTQ